MATYALRDGAETMERLIADLAHVIDVVAPEERRAARVPGSAVRILAGHGQICLIAPDIDLARILEEWHLG